MSPLKYPDMEENPNAGSKACDTGRPTQGTSGQDAQLALLSEQERPPESTGRLAMFADIASAVGTEPGQFVPSAESHRAQPCETAAALASPQVEPTDQGPQHTRGRHSLANLLQGGIAGDSFEPAPWKGKRAASPLPEEYEYHGGGANGSPKRTRTEDEGRLPSTEGESSHVSTARFLASQLGEITRVASPDDSRLLLQQPSYPTGPLDYGLPNSARQTVPGPPPPEGVDAMDWYPTYHAPPPSRCITPDAAYDRPGPENLGIHIPSPEWMLRMTSRMDAPRPLRPLRPRQPSILRGHDPSMGYPTAVYVAPEFGRAEPRSTAYGGHNDSSSLAYGGHDSSVSAHDGHSSSSAPVYGGCNDSSASAYGGNNSPGPAFNGRNSSPGPVYDHHNNSSGSASGAHNNTSTPAYDGHNGRSAWAQAPPRNTDDLLNNQANLYFNAPQSEDPSPTYPCSLEDRILSASASPVQESRPGYHVFALGSLNYKRDPFGMPSFPLPAFSFDHVPAPQPLARHYSNQPLTPSYDNADSAEAAEYLARIQRLALPDFTSLRRTHGRMRVVKVPGPTLAPIIGFPPPTPRPGYAILVAPPSPESLNRSRHSRDPGLPAKKVAAPVTPPQTAGHWVVDESAPGGVRFYPHPPEQKRVAALKKAASKPGRKKRRSN